MINSSEFLNVCKDEGYTLFAGTPCSYLKPFINFVIDDEELDFVETTNEGDAVALSSGAWLAGQKSVVMFQNSGLGNAVNPITSLSYTLKTPFIGICTLRGEPGGPSDEPQHELMGQITTDLLDLMKVGWSYFPTLSHEIAPAFEQANKFIEENQRPYFFVMKKSSVAPYELKHKFDSRKIENYETAVLRNSKPVLTASRTDALKAIKSYFDNKGPIIATTGKTGRELFELEDTANQLYMVGSMGCALPIGLGIKKAGYQKPVCVVDGDGALLMRLGNIVLPKQLKTNGIVHIVLDNGVHDSTGGQETFSDSVDFAEIAKASGYDYVAELSELEDLPKVFDKITSSNLNGFIRFLIKPGSPKDLGRPTVTPAEVAKRLQVYLMETK